MPVVTSLRPAGSPTALVRLFAVAGLAALAAASCSQRPTAFVKRRSSPASSSMSTTSSPTTSAPLPPTTGTTLAGPSTPPEAAALAPLPAPAPLAPFSTAAPAAQGVWNPAGRTVNGLPAVYQTLLVPPGGNQPAGIAWMDTHLLSARLYSGSKSPGGGPYQYTAAIQPAQAASLVAAFNGGFMMNAAHGGYYTEGRLVDPLVNGAASLVIYADGNLDVGTWGSDLTMTPDVVAVRQNLVPLVAGGVPTAAAASSNWQAWGATCGTRSCSGPGIEFQWRSGLGVTSDGAAVYVVGPALDPLQLAELLARAGVVRGMELDINPDWPLFATYDPPTGGLAGPSNGSAMLATVRGPATFFQSWWNRDFVTMSARPN
jgi:hypothetical protein